MRNWLLEIAEDNPINLDIAFEHGDFPTRNAAASWLARQEAAGNLKNVGLMKDRQGRLSVDVFCNGWRPKSDNLRHEIIGTKIRILYQHFGFLRGYKVTTCLADMVMTDGEKTFEIEIDCGSMDEKRHKWRMKRHKCNHEILIITAPKQGDPEARLAKLKKWSKDLGERAFLTTLDRLTTRGPHAKVWEHYREGQELKAVLPAVASPFVVNTLATPEIATA